MLNNYCNLNCEYCFVEKQSGPNARNITMENFAKYIKFLKNNGIREAKLLGGEPTLHPKFKAIVKYLNSDDFFEKILIFTNALSLNEEMVDEIISPKVSFLVNYNKEEDIGKENFKKTSDNIDYLVGEYNKHNSGHRVTLGINISEPDFDYKYIVDKSQELGLDNIRYSLTVPTKINEDYVSIKEYEKFIPGILEFFKYANRRNIRLSIDCNNIPKCLFEKEELLEVILGNNDMCERKYCTMPLDIDMDLNVTRCFPFKNRFEVNLEDFNDMGELVDYFGSRIDKYRFNEPTFKECVDCELFKERLCQGGCLIYKFGNNKL
jgi:sulfatase maturation enzyme AslB (radical SAM superfamily)